MKRATGDVFFQTASSSLPSTLMVDDILEALISGAAPEGRGRSSAVRISASVSRPCLKDLPLPADRCPPMASPLSGKVSFYAWPPGGFQYRRFQLPGTQTSRGPQDMVP